jgi:hypothetical protein
MNILAPPLHNIVRQLIETGVMSMDFVRLERNLTDPLTKTLARRLVSETSREIGLIPKWWHCDWYPTSVIGDPIGNEVANDHGMVLSFYSLVEKIIDESISMV